MCVCCECVDFVDIHTYVFGGTLIYCSAPEDQTLTSGCLLSPILFLFFSPFFSRQRFSLNRGVTMSATLVCQQVPGIFLSLLSPALGSQRRSSFNMGVRDLNSGLYARLSSPLPSDPSSQVWQCLFFSLNILCFFSFYFAIIIAQFLSSLSPSIISHMFLLFSLKFMTSFFINT